MTSTRTHTTTTTRPAAVGWQYAWVMVSLLPNGQKWFDRAVRPALEQRVLRAVQFFAQDTSGTTRAEFHLLADWEEHRRRTTEKALFVIPPGWTDEVSPQLRLAVKRFAEQVDEEELSVRAVLSLKPGRQLSGVPALRRGKPRRLSTGRIMCDEELRHLPELRCFFAQAND